MLEVKQNIEAALRGSMERLQPYEAAVLTLLRGRVSRELQTGRKRTATRRKPAIAQAAA